MWIIINSVETLDKIVWLNAINENLKTLDIE